jgi:hypothetical protein
MQTEHYMANMGRTEPTDRFGHIEPVEQVAGSERPQVGAGRDRSHARSSGAHSASADARPDPFWSDPGGL